MNHYVYQITNNINGKIYIGKRSCKCSIEDDTYFGSGVHISRAIKKHGKENFTKTIIDVCESAEQAYELESVIVNVDFAKRADTYNICSGGYGVGVGEGHPMFGKTQSDETKMKISANHVGMKGKNHTEYARAKMSANNGMKGKTGETSHMFGKTLSDETKAKMSAAKKGKVFSDKPSFKKFFN